MIGIEGCFSSKDPLKITLQNVTFLDNVNLGGTASLDVKNGHCYELVMKNVRFQHNKGKRGSRLTKRNYLKHIHLVKNNMTLPGKPSAFLQLRSGSFTKMDDVEGSDNYCRLISVKEGRLRIKHSNFTRTNTIHNGAVIGRASKLYLFSSKFESNHCDGYGAAISFVDGSRARIRWSKFIENTATTGGAVFVDDGEVYFDDVHFSGNDADYGGALYTKVGKDVYSFIHRSKFTRNKAAKFGGGIYAVVDRKDHYFGLEAVTFENNTANRGGRIPIIPSLNVLQEEVRFSM